MQLRLYGLVEESYVDGPGIRMTVFVQGCDKKCPSCQNVGSWDYNGGYLVKLEDILTKLDKNPLLDGVSFSGGEPFDQPFPLSLLAKEIHARGFEIITWSGYTYEEILKDSNKEFLLRNIDYLIDGRFDSNKKSLSLKWRGSSNQRIIDIKRTRKEKELIVLEDIPLKKFE